MKASAKVETDFKKWILFNNTLNEFQNLYELYSSVDTKQSAGSVAIEENTNEDQVTYTIRQDGNEASLELIGEANRKRFLEYLVKHYFPNQEIGEWYQSKIEALEKSNNHTISSKTETINFSGFKIHSKESNYYNIRIFISAIFYFLVAGFIVVMFWRSVTAGSIALFSLTGLVLLLALMRRITQGLFIGMIKGSSVRINEYQYPEIFKIVRDQAREIGLSELPDVYITYGHFNAFVTRLARKKYLMLYSEVIETASKGDHEVLKFVIGHELGHLKRKHLNKEVWLAPSLFIPFLRQAHSRACEYTCDRVGFHFSPQGSIEGIIILATGKEIYTKIDANRYIEDSNADDSFWVWLSEKFLSHPHTFKRLSAIKRYSQVQAS